MTQALVYLNFPGNTREVMNFYKDCFGGELDMQTIGESPMAAQMPKEIQNHLIHSVLIRNGRPFLFASDMPLPGGLKQGNNFGIMVHCDTEEEVRTFFAKLSDGGKVWDPVGKKFWGAIFGATDDKFGIRWSFNYDPNAPKHN